MITGAGSVDVGVWVRWWAASEIPLLPANFLKNQSGLRSGRSLGLIKTQAGGSSPKHFSVLFTTLPGPVSNTRCSLEPSCPPYFLQASVRFPQNLGTRQHVSASGHILSRVTVLPFGVNPYRKKPNSYSRKYLKAAYLP